MADLAVEKFLSEDALRMDIDFLSGDFCKGRGASQAGLAEAGMWALRQFKAARLMPMEGTMCQTFIAGGHVCHNIVGMLPARIPAYLSSGSYVIIMAHYDNLGILEGKTYPGADSNASGVAVLKRLVTLMRYLGDNGSGLPQNIIFAALDGNGPRVAGGGERHFGAVRGGEAQQPRLVGPGGNAGREARRQRKNREKSFHISEL